MSGPEEIRRHLSRAAELADAISSLEDTLDQLLSVREVPLSVPSGFFRTSVAPCDPSQAPPVAGGSTIGSRIRAAREARGLTQADLAAATGIKRPNITRLERNGGLPNLATLMRIADGLRVPVSSLIP